MKTLYWKTRPLRRTASGGRRAHWPGVAFNLALAFALVALPVCSLVLAGLDGNFAELFGLADALLPIVVTWALALFAVGFGYRLTVPADRLPGEAGEPPAQRTTRWFHWANLRAVFFGGLAAATVLAAAHTLSGWQGRRAWEAYRAEAEKRGVEFDLEKLMPPPVPDAENFAATPLLRQHQGGNPEFLSHRATNRSSEPFFPVTITAADVKEPLPRAEWQRGERLSLPRLQTYYRSSTNFPAWPSPRAPAEDVLKALSRFDAELVETHTAAMRPHVRFNTLLTEDGISTLIPHLAAMKSLGNVVALRSVALLAAGRADDAFADAKLAFRLSETVRGEAILISHLFRLAMHSIALRTVWEGLADHRWTDAQLAHWQADLAKRDFAAELRHAMAGERAFGNRAIEFIRRRPEMLPMLGDPEGTPLSTPQPAMKGVPAGWFYQEQINYNRMFDDYLVSALPAGTGPLNAQFMQARSDAMIDAIKRVKPAAKSVLRHRVLSCLLLPALHKTMIRACQAQTFTQLAATACALGRHWLARGSYPESLGALAPEFGPLPPDPMSGQPFRYERTADGRFRLWSLGWNGKDDGGTVAMREPAKREVDFEQGDWVWPVPQQ